MQIPAPAVIPPAQTGEYHIAVALQYRKVDQFLLNYLFGETNKLTAPVTEIARATTVVRVQSQAPSHSAVIPGKTSELAQREVK